MPTASRIGLLVEESQARDLAEALLADEFCLPNDIFIVPLITRERETPIPHDIRWNDNIHDLRSCKEAIVLAGNREQVLRGLEKLAGRLKTDIVVISLVEDIPLEGISQLLKHRLVTRAIVTPFVGRSKGGLVFWFENQGLKASLVSRVVNILDQFGVVQKVESETQLDECKNWIDSLISGVEQSMQAFVDTGIESGLPESNARELTYKLWGHATALWRRKTNGIGQIPEVFRELNFNKSAMPTLYAQIKSLLVSILLFRRR